MTIGLRQQSIFKWKSNNLSNNQNLWQSNLPDTSNTPYKAILAGKNMEYGVLGMRTGIKSGTNAVLLMQ